MGLLSGIKRRVICDNLANDTDDIVLDEEATGEGSFCGVFFAPPR